VNGIYLVSDVTLISTLTRARAQGAHATAEAVRREMERRCGGPQEILERYQRFAVPYAQQEQAA
jgi:hypothetical protein